MMPISYAQCWEDAAVLRAALQLSHGDTVLSIASGGDNSLALLLDDPASVTSIDYNPAQIHLLELKAAAMQVLDYDDFLAFVGAQPSPHRLDLYDLVKHRLCHDGRAFWDHQRSHVEYGIIHSGKFERYMQAFRKWILPLIVSRATVARFLASTFLDEQQTIYRRLWISWRWRSLFSLFFSKLVLGRYGRCEKAFSQVSGASISQELFRRVKHGLTAVTARNNYLLRYMLTGHYDLPRFAPPYLRPHNYYLIRERLDRLRLTNGNLSRHLASVPAGTYSAYNLSDVFEYLSPAQTEELSRSLVSAARPGAHAAFWTMFISQSVPDSLENKMSSLTDRAVELESVDLGFFYGSFNIWRIGQPTKATPLSQTPSIHEVPS